MGIEKVNVLRTFYSNAKKTDYVLAKDAFGSLKLYKGQRDALRLAEKKDVQTAGPTKWIYREHFDREGNTTARSWVSKFIDKNGKKRYEIDLHDTSLEMEKGRLKVSKTVDGNLKASFKQYAEQGKASLNILDRNNLSPLAKRVLNLFKI